MPFWGCHVKPHSTPSLVAAHFLNISLVTTVVLDVKRFTNHSNWFIGTIEPIYMYIYISNKFMIYVVYRIVLGLIHSDWVISEKACVAKAFTSCSKFITHMRVYRQTTHMLSIERADWPNIHNMLKTRDALKHGNVDFRVLCLEFVIHKHDFLFV